jgi:hypothetical protein
LGGRKVKNQAGFTGKRPAVKAGSLVTLPAEADLAEITPSRICLPHKKVEDSGVAPHKIGGIIGIELR